MTFIVGITCQDGLVVASEQLESDGITKRYRQKIHSRVIGDEWGVLWAGTGPSYVVDKFSDKFAELVGNGDFDRAKLELHAEMCLQFIRKQYSRPSDAIDIVMAIFGTPMLKEKGKTFPGLPEFHLYRGGSESACIAEQRDYCCAGMDCTLAVFALDAFVNPFGCVAEACQVAFIVTSLMKKYAEGCGGKVDCFYYQFGKPHWTPLLDSQLATLKSDFPVTDVEKAMTEFWAEHPKNVIMKAKTEAEIQMRRVTRSQKKNKRTK
ncbi:MAG TPA: hypothetical protein VKQ11_20095 [Candidatus Sulfotelmatobacter sp.]|nr:hypothetical protein [Candidatus Sulfotelmatobacter sp.]